MRGQGGGEGGAGGAESRRWGEVGREREEEEGGGGVGRGRAGERRGREGTGDREVEGWMGRRGREERGAERLRGGGWGRRQEGGWEHQHQRQCAYILVYAYTVRVYVDIHVYSARICWYTRIEWNIRA